MKRAISRRVVRCNKKAIVVAGYPKSGNTWACRLIAEVVRCPVAGFFGSPNHAEMAIEGSERSSDYAVYKAHHAFSRLPRGYWKIIYIVRDPRDIVVSGASYFDVKRYHRVHGVRVAPVEAMLRTLCSGGPYSWCKVPWKIHVRGYLHTDALIVKYEELLAQGEQVLLRVCGHLGLERTSDELRSALDQQSFAKSKKRFSAEGNMAKTQFLRNGQSGAFRSGLSQMQIKRLERNNAAMMSRLGYTCEIKAQTELIGTDDSKKSLPCQNLSICHQYPSTHHP